MVLGYSYSRQKTWNQVWAQKCVLIFTYEILSTAVDVEGHQALEEFSLYNSSSQK